MDILIENKIGAAHVSLRGGRHRHGPTRQIEMAAAFPARGVPDASSVEAFLQPLRHIGATDLDDVLARFTGEPLPPGYRHFRLFAADTGEQWHSSFVVEQDRMLSSRDVLFGALNHPTLEISEWRTTEWMPDLIPGVLDLEIDFVAVPRTKPFRLKP